MNLRERMKENPIIHRFGRKLNVVVYVSIKPRLDAIKLFVRKHTASKYSYLRKYKSMHEGQRCFIVCTGPSLTYDDLELIKNEISFSMNSMVKAFENTDWRPRYYGIQDINVYEKMKPYLIKNEFEAVFIGDIIEKMVLKPKREEIVDNGVVYPLNLYGHQYGNQKPKFAFSDDISCCVYDGYSITYSLIQIAVYMGFKEIYLLGCDNSYPKHAGAQYFVSHGVIDPNAQQQALFQRSAFEVAKKFCETHGATIYNATRGGELEVFERVKLEEVLK